jgi:hypothetical protein
MINIKIREGNGHVCSVPGCKNRNTKAITRGSAGVGVIYLCEECIAALAGKKAKAKKDEDKGGEEE